MKTTLSKLLDEIREDRIKHPIKYKWFCFKTEAYCLITNNGYRLGEVAEHKTSLVVQNFKFR